MDSDERLTGNDLRVTVLKEVFIGWQEEDAVVGDRDTRRTPCRDSLHLDLPTPRALLH